MLSLPLESRSSISDYVGRHLPGASLDEGRLRLRGGRPEDTAYELDGLRLRRLSVPLALLERLDVASAGYGAAWSDVLGGVVAGTTRSGSNRFHADVDLSAEFREPVTAEVSPSISGPIWRDHLYYVLAISGRGTREPMVRDPEGIVADSRGRDNKAQDSALKLTFLPHPAHRLESLTLVSAAQSDYGGALGTELDAQPSFEALEVMTSLRWIGRWNAITAHSQVAFRRGREEELPLLCRSEPEACEMIPAMVQKFPRMIRSDNWSSHQIARDTEWQFVNGLEAHLFERPWIRQRLRASSRVSVRELAWRSHTPGDQIFELNQGPEALTTTFANDPRVAPPQFGWSAWSGSSLATNHALEGETRLFDRLWIMPGMGLAAGRAHTDFLTAGGLALTPHLGLAWDVRGDGRTWLRASSQQRASADLEGLVRFSRRTPVSQRCTWNPDTSKFDRGCVFSGGFSGSVGLPCGPDNVTAAGTPCGQALQLPRAWEHSLGAEHEVGRGVRPFVELVYRRSTNLPTVAETNRIWTATGEVVSGFRNGRAEHVMDYSTTATADRYLDVTLGVRKDAGALRLLGAYTFNRHRYLGEFLGADPTFESVEDERPHSFRALVSYDFWGYGSVGTTATVESGAPISRIFGTGPSSFRDPREAGINPGTNLNDPTDDRPSRRPAVTRLNLQLRVHTKRLVGLDFHLYADVINLLDDHESAIEDPTSFIPLRAASQGRWTRIGLEYRY
jgi:hypothetical protein